MPRGGVRHGTPGKAYGNRADLRAVKPTAAPDQTYGEAGRQLASQQQMPIAPQPVPSVPLVAPGQHGPLTRATERPDEPVSTGAPWGPGANEMNLPTAPESNDADLARLRRQLPLLQIMASNPNASAQTRALYRQVLMSHLDQA